MAALSPSLPLHISAGFSRGVGSPSRRVQAGPLAAQQQMPLMEAAAGQVMAALLGRYV